MAVLVPSAPVTHLEFTMNIELEEVVRQDVSDDALEQAAGGAQVGLLQYACIPTGWLDRRC